MRARRVTERKLAVMFENMPLGSFITFGGKEGLYLTITKEWPGRYSFTVKNLSSHRRIGNLEPGEGETGNYGDAGEAALACLNWLRDRHGDVLSTSVPA